MQYLVFDINSSSSSAPFHIHTLTTGDSDYEGESISVTFPAGVNVISFNVTINDESAAERIEVITLNLEIPSAATAMGVIKGSPDSTIVNIMVDDGR